MAEAESASSVRACEIERQCDFEFAREMEYINVCVFDLRAKLGCEFVETEAIFFLYT